MINKNIFSLLLVGMFMISFASAWDFDNTYEYFDDVDTAIIHNCDFWIGTCWNEGEVLAEVTRTSLHKERVGVGIDTWVGGFNFTTTGDFSDVFGEMYLTDMKNGNEISRGKQYKYKQYKNISVDDYDWVDCQNVLINGTIQEVCSWEEVGSHYEIQMEWIPIINPNNNFSAGVTYEIGIFVDVEANDWGDWLPEILGVEIPEWSQWSSDLTVGLVSSWDFEEASGDAIDNQRLHNGTTSAVSYQSTGKIDYAYDFPANAGVTIASPGFQGFNGNGISLNAWVNSDRNADVGYGTILEFKATSGTGQFYIHQRIDRNGFGFQFFDGSWYSCDVAEATPALGTWHMLTGVYDESAGTIKVYFDGVLKNTTTGITTSFTTTSGGVAIGKAFDGAWNYFDGDIDLTFVWNRTIDQAEVTQLWNSGSGIKYQALVDNSPQVILTSPVNNSNFTSNVQDFIATVTDDKYVQNVSLKINGTIVNTSTSHVNGSYTFRQIIPEGVHNWSILAYDNASQSNESEVRFFNYTQPPIVISLATPIDNYNSTVPLINFNCSANSGDGAIELNLILNGLVNQTIVNSTTGQNLTLTKDINLSEGDYNWSCSASNLDSSGQSVNRSLTVEYSDPVITLATPTNNTISLVSEVTFTFTATDDNGIENVTLYMNNSAINFSSSGVNGSYSFTNTIADGLYTWNISSFSVLGKEANSSTLNLRVHTVSPTTDILSPTSRLGYILLGDNETLYYSISEAGENLTTHLVDCWYDYAVVNDDYFLSNTSLNGTGTSWNFRTGGNTSSLNDTLSLGYQFPVGPYTLDVSGSNNFLEISDFYSTVPNCYNASYSIVRAGFNAGTTGYYACVRNDNNFTYIIRQDNYDTDKTNFSAYNLSKTIDCLGNSSVFGYSGVNLLTIFAEDEYGQIGYSNSTWDYSVVEESQAYNPTSVETALETFSINLTYSTLDWTAMAAYIDYNGTEHLGISSGAGGEVKISSSFYVASVDTETDFIFFWRVLLTNNTGSYNFTSASHNQTVSLVNFSICDYSSGPQLLFKTFSTTNATEAVNATFSSAWRIKNAAGGDILTRSYQDLLEVNSTWGFCIEPNSTTYTVSVDVTVDATAYTPTTHFIVDTDYSNSSSENISIYLLNDSYSTLTELQVTDLDSEPVEDVYITIQRYDMGSDTYFNVAMARTDSLGSDLAYLKWYEDWYRFVGVYNGEIVFDDGPKKVSSTPLTFKIGDEYVSDYEKFRDITYSLTFNEATDNFVLTFVTTSGTVSSSCLRTIKRNVTADYLICDTCATSSSATLYCNIGGEGNGTFIAGFYATGSPAYWIDQLYQYEGVQNQLYDLIGRDNATGMALLMAGIVLSFFLVTPALGILGAILGIFLAIVLGFQPFEYISFVGIIVVGLAMMWAVQK